jgi:hypothetical protein
MIIASFDRKQNQSRGKCLFKKLELNCQSQIGSFQIIWPANTLLKLKNGH